MQYLCPCQDDIIIATAPKCGTTWTQKIVGALPWIDARFQATQESKWAVLAAQTHRHVLKSHLPVDGLPIYDDVRYMHIARDERDTLMPMHNHFTGFFRAQMEMFDHNGLKDPTIGRPFPRAPTDPRAYFHHWIDEGQANGGIGERAHPMFFGLEAGYRVEHRRKNSLLVHYNDLGADLDGEIWRIAAFLNIKVNETLWPDLVCAAWLESMQAAGDTLMPQAERVFVDGSRRFFNKSTNGRWHNVLTEDDLALYDPKVREALSPALAA